MRFWLERSRAEREKKGRKIKLRAPDIEPRKEEGRDYDEEMKEEMEERGFEIRAKRMGIMERKNRENG